MSTHFKKQISLWDFIDNYRQVKTLFCQVPRLIALYLEIQSSSFGAGSNGYCWVSSRSVAGLVLRAQSLVDSVWFLDRYRFPSESTGLPLEQGSASGSTDGGPFFYQVHGWVRFPLDS